MKLGGLLGAIPGAEFGASPDLEISSLAYNSQSAGEGTLFFAILGEKADGHKFIPQALERGAVAIVSERPALPELAARWVRVPKIRRALSEASHVYFQQPEARLKLVGITGTNGKTTTAYLLDSIFRAAGMASALFGTVEYRFAGKTLNAHNTTPESLDMLTYLDEHARHGGQAAAMEVSSHALAQERVWGFHFSAAVFTNLTQDHLDFHKDFQSYFEAKRRLFEGLGAPPPAVAAINMDDAWGMKLLDIPFQRLVTYGFVAKAQVTPKQSKFGPEGIEGVISTPGGPVEVRTSLLGRPNLMNIMAATAAALGLGLSREAVEKGVAALTRVPGRFDRVDAGQPFLVLVDYAHTDDALKNVLMTARELARSPVPSGTRRGRLIVVFGCGGDRDRAKRPLMGEAAGSLSDLAVLTSDNPRSEDPLRIMSDAMVGLQKTGKRYIAEVDRESAIRKALGEARDGDVVVVAGKGHETYQIFKDRTVPFDERQIVRRILGEMGYGSNARGQAP
jgi:UDP-N-acetylmuramoyl-L-alanyl-D-glutamate--2,6-diaminopimelate ligase